MSAYMRRVTTHYAYAKLESILRFVSRVSPHFVLLHDAARKTIDTSGLFADSPLKATRELGFRALDPAEVIVRP